jgi:hypothetical protein
MRTRSDTDYGAVSHGFEQDTWNGSSSSPTHSSGTVNSNGATFGWRMDDVSTPDFQVRQARGKYTFSPMEKARSLINASGGYEANVKSYIWNGSSWGYPRGYERSDSNYQPFHRFSENSPLAFLVHSSNADSTWRNLLGYSTVATARSLLLSRLYAKLSDSDAMVGVTLYEAKETADMISRAAKMAYRTGKTFATSPRSALRDLARLTAAEIRHVATDKSKSYRRASQSKALAKLAHSWLQLRYGWQALYYEYEDYTNLSVSDRTLRRTVVSSTDVMPQYTVSSDGTRDVDASYGERVHFYKGDTYARHTRLSAGAMYRTTAPLAPIDAVGGRRLFASTWEVMPFTFVLDWFINLSDILATIDTLLTCDILGSWLTTRHSLVWHRYNYGVAINTEIPNYWKTGGSYNNSCNVSDLCDHVIREANPAPPGSIQLRVKLNTKRVIDAAALLKVNSRKISRLLRGI